MIFREAMRPHDYPLKSEYFFATARRGWAILALLPWENDRVGDEKEVGGFLPFFPGRREKKKND